VSNESLLVLADGTEFEGETAGHQPDDGAPATGEVVFNTALSGYQEIITDPSYAGQMITFTYPHIGNYGVNVHDAESARPFCGGVIVRDLARRSSNWRATEDLHAFLRRHRVSAITGVDTRRLTRHLREHGAMPGAFGPDAVRVRAAAAVEPSTDGVDMVARVTTDAPYTVGEPDAPFYVVAYDFGIKTTILSHLVSAGCQVEVVPASTPGSEVLARCPDGVFLSNGPGDPTAVVGAVDNVRALVDGSVPIFGICLGHQILGLALGGRTFKLRFGHHGANHPVRHVSSGRVEISSQNHNYCVDADSIPGGVEITHVNLNDGTVEGLRVRDAPVFSVQHHPEAGPGPHDANYLFADFTDLMTETR
jgi:carbamoyl-phosphate synthase small subunit